MIKKILLWQPAVKAKKEGKNIYAKFAKENLRIDFHSYSDSWYLEKLYHSIYRSLVGER